MLSRCRRRAVVRHHSDIEAHVAGSLDIARSLARRPTVRAGAVILLAAGFAAGSLPLLDAPGYELGGLVALLLAGAMVRAALGPCAAFGPAVAFLPLLAGPTVLLGAALAVAVAFVSGGRRALAGTLYVLAALAALAFSLRAAYRGPAAFVFDPLLGGWPGPIYDEAIVPDLRAVLLRAAAAAEAFSVALVAEAFVRAGRGGLRAARGPIAWALALAFAAAGGDTALESLGLSGSRAALSRALGGRREGARCTLVLPAEKPAAAADALLAECEFQVADVARALGVQPPARVIAYVYRSSEEKRRLVGAGATEYAKPWLGEVHVVDAPLPHPVLRHELVHAVGAAIAGGPLSVPARDVVLVSAGLVEGLAAALETPRGRFTVHEWSRAARDLGLLPDVAGIVGPAGFYAQPPARAYTAAGSFLAFLLDRHGASRVREAYRTGDVAAATGVPLRALADGWSRFLDGIEPPPGLITQARAQLGRRSLFARPCAREVATLEARAATAAAAGRSADACALYEAAAARSGSAASLKAVGDVRARAGDLPAAAEAYRGATVPARRRRSRRGARARRPRRAPARRVPDRARARDARRGDRCAPGARARRSGAAPRRARGRGGAPARGGALRGRPARRG